jgi:hypothetical protein
MKKAHDMAMAAESFCLSLSLNAMIMTVVGRPPPAR